VVVDDDGRVGVIVFGPEIGGSLIQAGAYLGKTAKVPLAAGLKVPGQLEIRARYKNRHVDERPQHDTGMMVLQIW
jgi:hypothetical protein